MSSAFRVQGSGFRKCRLWAAILWAAVVWPAAVAEDEKPPPPDDRQLQIEKRQSDSDTPVIISATRTPIPYRDAASSATVIREYDLEALAEPLITDALRGVPGLDIRRNGPPGQTTSLFLRGTNDNHVKFMLDGIDVTDPGTPTGTPLLDHLLTSGVGQIEIIRGPQSTLYGSDAIGGVVNIITRTSRSGDPAFRYEVEGGSFYTSRQRVTAEAGNQYVHAFMAATYFDTQGISASSAGTERDPYRNTHLATRLGITPTDELSTDIVLHYIHAQTEFDNSGADNPFNQTDSEQLFMKVEPKLYLADGRWVSTLNLNLANQQRETLEFAFGSFFDFFFEGSAYEADWQNDIEVTEWNLLTLGAAYRYEQSESASDFATAENDRDIASVYVSDQFKLWEGRVHIVPGIRHDLFSDFGGHTTWRIAASYRHLESDTTFRGSFGTGFNAPSLFQLFDPFSGDPSLSAERSKGWDAGVEQRLFGGKVSVGATYFHNDIDELIEFDLTTFGYVQTGAARTRGVEAFAVIEPCENLLIRPSYTYTDAENLDTGAPLIRRPQHKGGMDVIYRFLDRRATVALGLFYVGERDDIVAGTFPGVVAENDDYVLVRIAASLRVHDNVELTARIENLLDEDYQDVLGFNSPGVAAYGGVRITIP